MRISRTQKANAASAELGKQIDALRADLTKLISNASDDFSDDLDQVGNQIATTGRSMRKAATAPVIDHPMAAMGIALGVGLLLGLFARRD